MNCSFLCNPSAHAACGGRGLPCSERLAHSSPLTTPADRAELKLQQVQPVNMPGEVARLNKGDYVGLKPYSPSAWSAEPRAGLTTSMRLVMDLGHPSPTTCTAHAPTRWTQALALIMRTEKPYRETYFYTGLCLWSHRSQW